MNDAFEQLQKTAEEGTKKWEHIEELVAELPKPDDLKGDIEKLKKLLIALVDYMRPLAPNADSVNEATKDIQDLLGKIMNKTSV